MLTTHTAAYTCNSTLPPLPSPRVRPIFTLSPTRRALNSLLLSSRSSLAIRGGDIRAADKVMTFDRRQLNETVAAAFCGPTLPRNRR